MKSQTIFREKIFQSYIYLASRILKTKQNRTKLQCQQKRQNQMQIRKWEEHMKIFYVRGYPHGK